MGHHGLPLTVCLQALSYACNTSVAKVTLKMWTPGMCKGGWHHRGKSKYLILLCEEMKNTGEAQCF